MFFILFLPEYTCSYNQLTERHRIALKIPTHTLSPEDCLGAGVLNLQPAGVVHPAYNWQPPPQGKAWQAGWVGLEVIVCSQPPPSTGRAGRRRPTSCPGSSNTTETEVFPALVCCRHVHKKPSILRLQSCSMYNSQLLCTGSRLHTMVSWPHRCYLARSVDCLCLLTICSLRQWKKSQSPQHVFTHFCGDLYLR